MSRWLARIAVQLICASSLLLYADDARTLINQGNQFRNLRQFDAAERAYRDALALTDGSMLATVHNNLGALFFDQSRIAEAEQHWQVAADGFLDQSNQDRLSYATTLVNLAELQRSRGNLEEAARLNGRALALREELSGPNSLPVAQSLNSMAVLALDRHQPDEAAKLLTRALEIRDNLRAPEDAARATVLHNLGEAYRLQGLFSAARVNAEKAVAIRTRLYGERHPETAGSLANLGTILEDIGPLDEALVYARKALEIRRELLPSHHPHLAVSMNNTGRLLMVLEQREEALQLLQGAVAALETSPQRGRALHATVLLNLGEWHTRGGDLAAADPVYREAIGIFERSAPRHPRAAEAYAAFARLLMQEGKLIAAEKMINEALAIRKRSAPEDSPEVLSLTRTLATLYRAQKRQTEADKLERSFR